MIIPQGDNEKSVHIVKTSEATDDKFEMQITSNFDSIKIYDNVTDILFNLNGERTKALVIEPVSTKVGVTVKFSKNSAIQIPPTSDNIQLEGAGKIVIDPIKPIDQDKEVNQINIKKVVPKQNKEMNLEPSVENLVINEIQSFGKTTLKGSSSGKKITCQNLRIESGSDFSPSNIIFEDIKIGLKSSLKIDDSNEIKLSDNTDITIYHNRTLIDRIFPIVVKNSNPDFSRSNIFVEPYDAYKLLPETKANEKFLIAQFINTDNTKKDSIYTQCTTMAGRFIEKNGFGKKECINVTGKNNEVVEVDLVVQKVNTPKDIKTPTPKKNGLSGAAIAGIVIACVVVVAVIIVLLVYFIAIRKKDKSSLEYDGSSIEI